MKSPICDQLGIEFPLIAFTHCRDVVCEVSKAGGMGVLGAAGYSPEQLEIELKWIDEHIDGMPYGVDLIVPTSMAGNAAYLLNLNQHHVLIAIYANFMHLLKMSRLFAFMPQPPS